MIDKNFYQNKETYSYEDMLRVIRDLRDPEEGCPWDRAQTHESITQCLIEECYEAVSAIRHGDMENLREELGDVLLQVVFHSQLAEDAGAFCLDDVIQGVCEKLVRRHPHVFGDADAGSPDEALNRWNATKAGEKKSASEAGKNEAQRVPEALPALIRAQKVLKKAEDNHLDPEAGKNTEEKFQEAFKTLLLTDLSDDNSEKSRIAGDFLLSTVDFLRKHGLDSEKSLTLAVEKYITRISN